MQKTRKSITQSTILYILVSLFVLPFDRYLPLLTSATKLYQEVFFCYFTNMNAQCNNEKFMIASEYEYMHGWKYQKH